MSKENAKRISGVYPIESANGKRAFARMLYPAQSDGCFHPDYEQIKIDIDNYFKQDTFHNPAGLRLALRNIDPDVLNLWLYGYVQHEDIADEDIAPNEQLKDAIRAGKTALSNALFNKDSKYQSQLVIRTLEGIGELTPQKKVIDINLGGLGTWEKASK